MKILDETTVRIRKRFETGLLWKNVSPELPEIKSMAINRLRIVENKVLKNKTIAKKYQDNNDNNLEKGYCRKLSNNTTDNTKN